jgi:PAT family beta-lactamase induction signal transducer AmpG
VPQDARRPSTLQNVRTVLRSPRLLVVVLLSFSSALPLGLVWTAIPTWMTQQKVDIRVVGLLGLAQVPWTFKFLWSPFVDRYPLPFLGRKRGWILLSQGVLFLLSLGFASVRPGDLGSIAVLAFLTAFTSATQDIAIDGYTVDVLRPEEYGMASGARTALGRLGLLITGGASITIAAYWQWPTTHLVLGALYIPLMFVTAFAPEPEGMAAPPRTLRAAVWEPFVSFLSQSRAIEILSFVVLYKLSDQLAQALISPFLTQLGFSAADVGFTRAVVGSVAIVAGTLAGGLASDAMGLGRALWIFGIVQTTAHLGYALLAMTGPNRSLLILAQVLEMGTSGLANGAFGVFLLRLTERRFSATQYALLSSLFAVPRVLASPIAGFMADALGWRDFFIVTVFTGIPGLLLLQRFVPWGARDAVTHPDDTTRGAPMSRTSIVLSGIAAGLVSCGLSLLGLAALAGIKAMHAHAGTPFELGPGLLPLLHPRTVLDWSSSFGVLVTGVTLGLGTAAALAVRRGVKTA